MNYETGKLHYWEVFRIAGQRIAAGELEPERLEEIGEAVIKGEFRRNGATRYLTAAEIAERKRKVLLVELED